MKRRIFHTAFLCICGCAIALQAQAPTPNPQATPGPTLRVTTRLVEANVIVQGKKGQPVGGLTKEDFRLFDQGKPQTISLFEAETNLPPAANTAQLPPNTFSNRLGPQAGLPSSVSVILLDALNTHLEDQVYARDQVVKFLLQLQPQDRVALYTLGSRLVVLHELTSDPSVLLAALGRYKNRIPGELAASEPEEPNTGIRTPFVDLDEELKHLYDPLSAFYTDRRVEITLGAFEAIAHHLAAVPGRKNLIWVSSSFPFTLNLDQIDPINTFPSERREYSPDVQKAAELLDNANMAVYPVDARGLTTARVARGSVRGPFPGLYKVQDSIDTMQVLASRTGGVAFYNTNDIKGAIRRAIDDSRVTYMLGFYPTVTKWDGKYHRLKVEVNRPDVHVRAREGYFATPEPVQTESPKDLRQELHDAANAPLDATGVGMTIEAHLPDVPGVNIARLHVSLDAHDLQLKLEKDRWKGAVDLLFIESAEDGHVLKAIGDTLIVAMLPATYRRTQQTGLGFTRELPLAAGAAELRVVVRDRNTRAVGSLTISLAKLAAANGR